MTDEAAFEPPGQSTFEQRMFQAATQLLLGPLAGREPDVGTARDCVTEQDAVDAIVLLLGMVHEQTQRGQLPFEVAVRMTTLMMVVRERVRPLPPRAGSPEAELLTADLTESVQTIRLAMRRPPA